MKGKWKLVNAGGIARNAVPVADMVLAKLHSVLSAPDH